MKCCRLRRDVDLGQQLLRGRQVARRDVEIVAATAVRLLAPPDAPLQLDGDPFSAPLPLAVTLAAGSLEMLVPAAI